MEAEEKVTKEKATKEEEEEEEVYSGNRDEEEEVGHCAEGGRLGGLVRRFLGCRLERRLLELVRQRDALGVGCYLRR